jgi:DNA invertase Pin-like site-specific DNA recombinase
MPAQITPEHLSKIAIVYVRQSTPQQVKHNRQSQLLQYDLVDLAKAYGWLPERIIVVDEDLGKSASGSARREGFESTLTRICLGEVGAIFCGEASRLARNGREWHQLIEFCSIVGALVIDYEGAYDPRLPSDRLLLGVKGTVSQFELDLFRKRAQDAIRKKAQSGELWFSIPAAFVLTEDSRCEINPDLHVQQIIQLVFQKFRELAAIRQVRLWFCREKIEVPVRDSHQNNRIVWRLPSDSTIRHILTNSLYAGTYIFPHSKVITRIIDGKPVKSTVMTTPEEYLVVIHDLFPSYITWEEFQQNQTIIANNTIMKGNLAQGAARKGEALLIGLVYCQRCSRRMHIRYRSKEVSPFYTCRSTIMGGEVKPCPTIPGRRLDPAVLNEVFAVLLPHALEAALHAEDKRQQELANKRDALSLALEQARYEAERIKRQLEAVEPEKHFVFRELTKRWEQALAKCHDLEQHHALAAAQQQIVTAQEHAMLFELAQNLDHLWHHPATTIENKKRLLRTLINQIWVQVGEDNSLTATIHWQGGVYTELVLKRIKRTPARLKEDSNQELLHIIKQLALCADDTQIARVLNRLKRKTDEGHTWKKYEVAQFRGAHKIPAFSQKEYDERGWLNLKEAAKELNLSMMAVKKLIKLKIIPAQQVVPSAPWVIERSELDKPAIRSIVNQMKQRHKIPLYDNPNQLNLE